MPPSAQRRTKTRKHEPAEKSDADDADTIATPSRKRRKVRSTCAAFDYCSDWLVQVQPANNGTPDRAETAIANQTASSSRRRKGRSSDISLANATEEEIAEEVIRNFRVPKQQIQARIDHANEKHEIEYPAGKTAYAKISGNGWTYYVTEIEVRIGRPPDERYETGNGTPGAGDDANDDKSLVHIDLGPSKLVSRQHAEIKYDMDAWSVTVIGRNGIKLDEEPLPRGTIRTINSGSVIEIAGTQMMFVTPGKPPVVHPKVLAYIPTVQDDEDDEAGQFQAPPRPSQRTPGNGASGTGHQKTSSRDQNNYQNSGRDNYSRHNGYTDHSHHDGTGDLRSSATKSPAYARGLMLETTEDIDYSLDTAKDIKPPHSYAQLIGMAILSNPEEKLTLSKIYDFIKDHYAFYRFSGGGWQVRRVCLSLCSYTY